jgi:stage III sporulation protein AH
MKKTKLIGKRQILLAGLVFSLGLAVWLNMKYAADVGDLAVDTGSKYLGDAQYVNSDLSGESVETAGNVDFFESARADREKAKNDALGTLKGIVDDVKSDDASKKSANEKIERIAANIEKQSAAETLIKAKGFQEVVVIIGDSDVNVVLKKDGELTQSESVQILDIINAQTGVGFENIKVVTVK